MILWFQEKYRVVGELQDSKYYTGLEMSSNSENQHHQSRIVSFSFNSIWNWPGLECSRSDTQSKFINNYLLITHFIRMQTLHSSNNCYMSIQSYLCTQLFWNSSNLILDVFWCENLVPVFVICLILVMPPGTN